MRTSLSSMYTATERLTANKTCKFTPTLSIYFSLYRRYTAEGKAVYMVAALGVVMDTQTCQQQFYGGTQTEMGPKHENATEQEAHRDDILSMDISADRETVVTGETGPTPAVHVWKASSGEKVAQFNLA